MDIIQQAKEIMDNYYINEKNLIESLADEILINFIKNDIFDNFKNVNLYNANNKVDVIITNVQTQFKESINLQLNGYFETQKEINNNKQYTVKLVKEQRLK